jgi:hypothetical protein
MVARRAILTQIKPRMETDIGAQGRRPAIDGDSVAKEMPA